MEKRAVALEPKIRGCFGNTRRNRFPARKLQAEKFAFEADPGSCPIFVQSAGASNDANQKEFDILHQIIILMMKVRSRLSPGTFALAIGVTFPKLMPQS